MLTCALLLVAIIALRIERYGRERKEAERREGLRWRYTAMRHA